MLLARHLFFKLQKQKHFWADVYMLFAAVVFVRSNYWNYIC